MGIFTSHAPSKPATASMGVDAPMGIEEIRRLTRQRLIGALLLLVLGVVLFSVLLDTAPRPVVEVPIEIVRPLPPSAVEEGFDSGPPRVEIRTVNPLAKPTPSPIAKPKTTGKPAPVLASPIAAPAQSVATPSSPPVDSNARVVLHIGSFQTEKEVLDARSKAQKAGLQTYIQVVNTSKGKFTRVRIGPFENSAAAQKVLSKAKAAGLEATEIRPL